MAKRAQEKNYNRRREYLRNGYIDTIGRDREWISGNIIG